MSWFGDSPGLENDDDDIEALESFLAWDEQDEAEVEESVAATMNALDQQQIQQQLQAGMDATTTTAAAAGTSSTSAATTSTTPSAPAPAGMTMASTAMLPNFMNLQDANAFLQQLSNMGGQPSPLLTAMALSSANTNTTTALLGGGGGLPPPLALPAQQVAAVAAAAKPPLPAATSQQQQAQAAVAVQQAQQQQQQPKPVPIRPQPVQSSPQAPIQPAPTSTTQQQSLPSLPPQNLSASTMLPPAALNVVNLAQAQLRAQQQSALLPLPFGGGATGAFPNLFPGGMGMAFPPVAPTSAAAATSTGSLSTAGQPSQAPTTAATSTAAALASSVQANAVLLRQMQQVAAQMQPPFGGGGGAMAAAPRPPPTSRDSNALLLAPRNNKRKATDDMLSAPTMLPTTMSAPTMIPTRGSHSNIVSCSDTDGENGTKTPLSKMARTLLLGEDTAVAATTTTSTSSSSLTMDTSHMSAEEKAQVHRDRNREHARNTRLRKKAYLEKLKSTVDELCRERDTLVSERAGAANVLVEMHNTRTEVLMSFFALRSSYETRRDLWASILDESCFCCVLPVTPYRSFPAAEVQTSKCQRTVLGIDAMMADTASLHVLLNSLIDRRQHPTAKVHFRYTLVTEDAVVAGNQLMARWVMATTNLVKCGARAEVSKQGMLCCKFNSAHKIVGLELMFDVMAFMLQLKQAAGTDAFAVVPNTVQTCQRSFAVPMVMVLAERPYTIVQVNQLWEDMTGYTAEEVVGKTSACAILQGPETERSVLEELMVDVRYKRPTRSGLVNYTKTRKRFRNFLNAYPLSTDSKITHYVALTLHVDDMDAAAENNKEEAVEEAASVPRSELSSKDDAEMPPPSSSPSVLEAVTAVAVASVTDPSSSSSSQGTSGSKSDDGSTSEKDSKEDDSNKTTTDPAATMTT